MSPCEAYAALLDAFLDGELTAEQSADVQRHLEGCPACRAYVDDLNAIRAELPDVEDTQLPEDFTASVMEAVARTPQERPKRQPWGKLAVAAACLALIVLLQKTGLPMGGRYKGFGSGSSAPAVAAPASAESAASSAFGAAADAAGAAETAAAPAEAPMAPMAPFIEETEPAESPEAAPVVSGTAGEPAAPAPKPDVPSGSPAPAPGESGIVPTSPAEPPVPLDEAPNGAHDKDKALRGRPPVLTLTHEAADYLADYTPFAEVDGAARYELTPEAYAALLAEVPGDLIVPPIAPTAAGENVIVALLND